MQQAAESDDHAPTIISSARKPLAPDAHHAESLVGRKLGHFELIESVGVGGMAAVIKAQDLDLGRVVALKILPPDMATDPENISRFKQEARAAAKLDHENVARVYYCGDDQGLHFIAFEFVEGDNLRVLMDKHGGLLPVAEGLHYLIQVTAGLSHAASRGVVHRDIKPSNIIITPNGKAKIVDMGLARNLDPRASNGQLTHSGVTLGTFDYISPEQAIEPRSADVRSDLYSLGCTFYHVFTGRAPVPEGTAAKKLHCHQHVAPLDPRELNPTIPDEMAAILGKMMAKDPEQRYQHPDHLLGHLVQLAHKLNVSTGPVANEGVLPYVDQPLPASPSLSAVWIGIAALGLVIGLFAVTGGFGGGKQSLEGPAFWQNDVKAQDASHVAAKKDKTLPIDPVEPVAAVKGPREAKNVSEFVALLKQPNAHIKLKPGVVYDLTRVSRKDGDLPRALFEGSQLVIESDRPLDPPTVRLFAAPADDGQAPRFGALTIRGPADGSLAKVTLSGIRFEMVADDLEAGQAGVSILNVDEVDVVDCAFVPPAPKGNPEDGPAAIAVVHKSARETPPEARFVRCWFAPGNIAIQLRKAGGQRLLATECAFGPQFAAVRVQGEAAADAESRGQAELRFESCSALMTQGTFVEIDDSVPCVVTAGWSLFSNPELPDMATPRAFIIRQLGALAAETRFDGLKTADTPPAQMPNGYHHVLAFGNGDLYMSFDDCKQEQVPIADLGARLLVKSPWQDEQPIKRLHDSPRQVQPVFTVDLKQEVLRLEPDKNRNLLGAKYLPGMRIHTLYPFESLTPDAQLAANVKVWQPDFPESKPLPTNFYRTLHNVIGDLKKGDVLAIRHNGPLEVDPDEFKKADTDVTIRPDDGYRPVLIPKAPGFKKDAAIFKLYGGQLTLENLHFRLKADRAPAVVALPGGGQCSFRNCTATMDDGDDLALVSLADPRGEMMMTGMNSPEKWPTPHVVVENSALRGRGRLLTVHASRPFDLRVKNSLAVLDGSLIGVEPAAMDLAEAGVAHVTLDHVTTYLTRHLLNQKAAERRTETKGIGLVQVQIHAANCLFVPAQEQAALVFLDRIDTLEQMESVFAWKDGRQNCYGFKSEQILLHIQPENTDTTMRVERIDRDRWLARWREVEYAVGEVRFKFVPASRRFDGVKAGDFEISSIQPPLKSSDPSDFGAPSEMLRRLAFEE